MKNLFKILSFFLVLFLILFIYFFYIYIPQKKYLSDLAETEIVNIFLKHGELIGINRDTLLLREGNIFCKKETVEQVCKVAMKKYALLRKKIPSYASYYFCDNKYIVMNLSSGLHYISEKSPSSLTESGLIFFNNNNWWLSYKLNEDIFNDSGARCYPWDNLEDYWKRYGKATPEEIQAVIDTGKPTQ